jgi:23S rRNA pseudouridine2605 synthase
VDDKEIETKKRIIIMLNKPRGVITTRSDERGRPSIYSLLGEIRDWVFPVGRLDKESEGLLLCTNDNALGEALTGPDHRVPKVYRVGIARALSVEDRTLFERGMILDGERLRPARVGSHGESPEGFWFEITLFEGRNRQIRRMCASRGIVVQSLKRVSIGPISLGSLRTGSFRRLTAREETLLRALTARPREARSNAGRRRT